MEERSEGILLRPTGPVVEKLSWEDTAREMAASHEDWSAWDTAAPDGLEHLPWQADRKRRVAGVPSRYRAKAGPSKRRSGATTSVGPLSIRPGASRWRRLVQR